MEGKPSKPPVALNSRCASARPKTRSRLEQNARELPTKSKDKSNCKRLGAGDTNGFEILNWVGK